MEFDYESDFAVVSINLGVAAAISNLVGCGGLEWRTRLQPAVAKADAGALYC